MEEHIEELVNKKELKDRFIKYVQIDTQSNPESETHPTTEKQKALSALLNKELTTMGLQSETDEFGYVYATVPANTTKKNVPVIAFCAHVDTAPDCSGTNVKPLEHIGYEGEDIVLPEDNSQVLSIENSPYLKNHIGKNIITTSGDTLLGADDKSGVAVIMQAVKTLLENKDDISYGTVKIVFTPDEEVGQGVTKINMEKIGASVAYTLDGGDAGSLEDETFSADGATIIVHGVISHPGYAKDKLVNAIKIAGEILAALPKDEWSPETTEKKEGFVHPVSINGIAEKATIEFIVRDFDTENLANHHARLKKIAEDVVAKHAGAKMEYTAKEQYRNMKDVLVKYSEIVENAAEAIKRVGLEPIRESIRGGTDGSRLSYMGLPCPNIFTGMQNIHSRLEWIGVEDMVKSTETVVEICKIFEEKA